MNKHWDYANRWLWQTPERALDIAYNAVLNIKALEDKYFNGQKIILPYKYGNNVASYLQSELSKCLRIAQTRLTEFKFSSFIFNLSVIDSFYSREVLNTLQIDPENQNYSGQTTEKVVASRTIDKLKLIDETLAKYKQTNLKSRSGLRPFLNKKREFDNKLLVELDQKVISQKTRVPSEEPNKLMPKKKLEVKSPFEKSGPFPSSIGRTFRNFKRDLMPNAESEVVEEFRTSRYRTFTSIRYLLLLILVPLLINQLSKEVIIEPLLNFWSNKPSKIFLNSSQEEKALTELKNFEEKTRFDFLIGNSSESSPEAREKELKDKANKLARKYSSESVNAVKNIFADILSVAAFIALLVIGKRQVVIFKSFANELFYGLSDSAKAFLIIIFTDMFVGFHSSHGWEVVLEGTFVHFGLPESKNFIFIFIATFPVILDSVFKYWIFRYLNQIFPSSVATYRNMNE